MEWILYILGGIFVLGILVESGIISEFFIMLLTILICCGIGAFICYLIVDTANPGATIGLWAGAVIYFLFCLLRIVSPNETTTYTGDAETGDIFSKHTTSSRGGGIEGIVMLIIAICVFLFI